MIRFTVPGRLAGANEIKEANRSHWSRGSRLVKDNKNSVLWHLKLANINHKDYFPMPVRVSFIWIEPNAKRDIDNVTAGMKVILDALVLVGVLENDTRYWIRELKHEFPEPDPLNPRVIVMVEAL